MLGLSNIPPVISSSYGDDEQTVPESYAKRVCASFALLGARGVTFLSSSGDDGVGENGQCITNDGRNTSSFLPTFPGGCPFITSVGATKNIAPEVAAFDPRNGFASGGGFSNYFTRPEYQNIGNAINNYIDKLEGHFDGLYNENGRAYPDIAAQGENYVTIWNGTVALLDGTSASAPTAAAILALVNDALIAAGKPVLGFLNPWLYSKGYEAFTDILSGSARGCNSTGFTAAKGWDAVTGFGTPVNKHSCCQFGVMLLTRFGFLVLSPCQVAGSPDVRTKFDDKIRQATKEPAIKPSNVIAATRAKVQHLSELQAGCQLSIQSAGAIWYGLLL